MAEYLRVVCPNCGEANEIALYEAEKAALDEWDIGVPPVCVYTGAKVCTCGFKLLPRVQI